MPRYRLYSTNQGQFFFTLLSPDGQRLLQSPAFDAKDLAASAIVACRMCSPVDAQYRRYDAPRGRRSFDLRSFTQLLLGMSEEYLTLVAREEGIQDCRIYGPVARLKNETGA